MLMQSTKVLASALIGALGVIGLACYSILVPPGGDPTTLPSLDLIAAQVLAGVAAWFACEHLGYRMAPLDPGTPRKEAGAQAAARWQSGMILRFAVAEVIAIGSLAGAFVVSEGGFLLYLIGGAISATLMAVHVFPWARPINKTQAVLDRDGGQSYLRELFDLDLWTGTEEDRPVLGSTSPRPSA